MGRMLISLPVRDPASEQAASIREQVTALRALVGAAHSLWSVDEQHARRLLRTAIRRAREALRESIYNGFRHTRIDAQSVLHALGVPTRLWDEHGLFDSLCDLRSRAHEEREAEEDYWQHPDRSGVL